MCGNQATHSSKQPLGQKKKLKKKEIRKISQDKQK